MPAATFADSTFGDSTFEARLHAIAIDLRGFVKSLQKPAPRDHSWNVRVQERCDELREQVAALRLRASAHKAAFSNSLRDIWASLETYAAETAESWNRRRFRTTRKSLAQSYEDLAAQLRQYAAARTIRCTDLRPINLPVAGRSIFHASIGLTGVLLYELTLSKTTALIILASILVVFAFLETMKRVSTRWATFMVERVFKLISRPHERYKTNSAIYYLLALVIVTAFTPKLGVCIAVLVLAFGDPAAMWVGSRWGRLRLRNDKSFTGSLGFLVVSFLVVVTYLAVSVNALSATQIVLCAFCVSLVGTITELFSGRIDDNLTIPVACAVASLPWVL